MNTDSKYRARIFHRAIRQSLLREWDPIGVGAVSEAQDEYDAYVPSIYKILIMHKTPQQIFDYLWRLETEHMGLTGDRQATEKFAERLMRIPEEVDEAMSQTTLAQSVACSHDGRQLDG